MNFRQWGDHNPPPDSFYPRHRFSVQAIAMRYSSILALLKLQHFDVLKLDLKGYEYDVIPDIVACSVLPTQVLIEFHYRLHGIDVIETPEAVNVIKRAGFPLFAVSPGGQELSFIGL